MSAATTERPKTVENIKVLQVGKYGVRVDEKTWFGVNEPLTPSHFVVGDGYKVSVSTAKTGKKYINEIVGVEDKGSAPAAQSTSPATSSDPMKAAEAALAKAKADAEAATKAKEVPATAPTLDAKSRQIQRQGSYQAALQSPFLGQFATGVDEYLSLVRKAAEASIKFINE